ncbi:tyrosine--tRNA ligase [Candidatus Kuenenbacteria bacterium CG11_big_fil_rev_8_21_14_0_20_37_9]|uniref:Tyrosine--tRNA ligase n=1 Tax=Candidatus Kuenenbacteria bacterium CG1_02_38_13 TaxID=1805235 RepID=A0A1J4U1J4_9BACT|nr:MAG: tyrosine--tRNA ligase [Candidatus Kuenenbacteria bacterium CG1_02_38_13]PIR05310.1 MAG: tyrosine--tRNA ligase [Candidatus Kuenenbacteria bacterium CG11_big_fil_rev_8_21_14_0_20_37_9]
MRLKNQAKIKELLEKGVEKIYPSAQFLESALKSGKKLTLYLGIDPTGPELHLGHSIPLMKLRAFQDLGHHIILLIGNFTALSGDPDKSHTRKRLTQKEISENIKNYKKQIGKILDLKGDNPVEFKYNADWLAKLTFKEVTEIASYFTVQQMISRDLFDRRIKDGNPIALHEFFYPLMQAYDSVAMNVDGEIGGNDQTFNMLAGRTLMKAMKNKEKFVLTMKLLADPTGKKMGKTEGDMITLDNSPKEMFGKVMSWPDSALALGFELCTVLPMSKVAQVAEDLQAGKNPRNLKAELAREIVSLYYNKKQAQTVEEEFNKIFRDKENPESMEKLFVLDIEYNIVNLTMLSKAVSSKSAAKRLVEQGAVKVGGKVIKKWQDKVRPQNGQVLKVGKRKFVELAIR